MSLVFTDKHESSDGSKKFCLQTEDGIGLEAVYMPGEEKAKLCVSSQAGCPFSCRHCATGLVPFQRNLSAAEISEQIDLILSETDEDLRPEILFYGIGEAFLNLDSVLESTAMLIDTVLSVEDHSQFYIATSGIPGMIDQFGDLGLDINLTISLHVADENKRKYLIPQSKGYPLSELKKDLLVYQEKTGKRVILHYCLIKNFNDDEDSVSSLREFVSGLQYELHIIPFNGFAEAVFEAPSHEEIESFVADLRIKGFNVFYKPSRGRDILAACGQLLAKSTKFEPQTPC